ncbi:MAG: hypothetical protein JXR19_09750 [Bacteroidia bacterium]
MGSKVQKYLLITIIVLVVLSIGARAIYNKRVNSYKWDEDDREVLINTCIDGTAHFGVRFPSLTQEYCSCTADSIMTHMKKAEYLQISTKSFKEQQDAMMHIISSCYNRYQTAIFNETELGDP